jgi:hypothetical protein
MKMTLRYAHLAPNFKMREVESLDDGAEDHAIKKTLRNIRQSV